MDIDELFGHGAELGNDVVVKAQLRFRIHPPEHPVAQDIVDRLVTEYDDRLRMICDEIDDVLKHADFRRSASSTPLVLVVESSISKAQVYAPGAHGGKWYRDGQGHIRYGEKPTGTFKQRAIDQHTGPQIGHYRPAPFMGMTGVDRDLTGYLMTNGSRYGFTPNELRLLGSWYGTNEATGALFDAFLGCAGLSHEDLHDDLSQLRFGAQKLTYEEAVFEFFAAQQSLFMGDQSEGAGGESWEILNDQIRPLLDSAFKKYEALKTSDDFKDSYSRDGDLQRRRFFDNAREHSNETRDLANEILSAHDPVKQVASVFAGLRALGLFSGKASTKRSAHAKNRPHLQDAVTLDDRLLVDDPKSNPLLAAGEKIGKLTASQLMLLYAASELHRRWDPDTRSYSGEKQRDIGPGALGEAALDAIADKSEQWSTALKLVQDHLDTLVDRLVGELNRANDVDAEPPKKRTSRKKATRAKP